MARYAARWGIEQAFADARNVLAPGRPATASGAPFALLVHNLIVNWYTR